MRLAVFVCAIGFAVIGGSTAESVYAQEKGDDAFKKGLDAISKEDWKQAEIEMRRAIEADKVESNRSVGGFIWGGKPYLPHFYRGQALYYLSNCTDALNEWDHSEQEMRKRNFKWPSELQAIRDNGRQVCEKWGYLLADRLSEAVASADSAINSASTAEQNLAKVPDDPDDHDAWTTSFRKRRDDAHNNLGRAKDSLENGRQHRFGRELEQARTLADAAGKMFRELQPELEAHVQELGSTRARAETAIKTAELADRDIDDSLRKLAELPGRIQVDDTERRKGKAELKMAQEKQKAKDFAGAETAAGNANTTFVKFKTAIDGELRSARDKEIGDIQRTGLDTYKSIKSQVESIDYSLTQRGLPPEDKQQVQKDLSGATKKLNSSKSQLDAAIQSSDVTGAQSAAKALGAIRQQYKLDYWSATLGLRVLPQILRNGVQQFFDAQYPEALNTLSTDIVDPIDTPLQLQMNLFRAAARFAIHERSGKADELEKARQEVREIKKSDPSFEPDPRVFTPHFINFFKGIRD